MRTPIIVVLLMCAAAFAQEPTWETEFQAARKAYLERDFAAAEGRYTAAVRLAEAEPDGVRHLLTTLRQLGLVYRMDNKLADSRAAQERSVEIADRVYGKGSVEFADVEIELALTLRGLALFQDAMVHAGVAIRARTQALGPNHIDLANDIAVMGMLALDLEQFEFARTLYKQALSVTETAAGADSPRVLPLLDIVARLYREENAYTDAEPYCVRALLIREATFGTEDAELILTLDNYAYVLFGQKKYDHAEVLYKRLLAVWEKSANPDHPMVAVTADKIQLFYAAQEKYEEAEAYAVRALAIRLKAHIESLLRLGKLRVQQTDIAEAEKLYRRALSLADEAQAPEEVLLPPLQTLHDLMKQLKRPQAAAALNARIKTLLIDKADREGSRRPRPVPQR